MRLIERPSWLLLIALVLAGCSGEADRGFCASHASEHWQHANEHPRMSVEYTGDGALAVQLALPAGRVAHAGFAAPADILELPVQCIPGALQRAVAGKDELLQFQAQCGEEQPANLSVPILDARQEIEEIEVTMTTPAVSKHFVIHQDCERAMFNVTGKDDYE